MRVLFRVLQEAVRIFLRGIPLNFYLPLSSIVLGNVTVCSEICRRFGGGSAGKSALSAKGRQSMHGMQIVQSRINTGDCASR